MQKRSPDETGESFFFLKDRKKHGFESHQLNGQRKKRRFSLFCILLAIWILWRNSTADAPQKVGSAAEVSWARLQANSRSQRDFLRKRRSSGMSALWFLNKNRSKQYEACSDVAQRVGFEPTCGFPQTDFECYEQLAINGFLRSLWFAVLPPRKSPMCKLFLIKSQKSPNYSKPRDSFKKVLF